MQALDLNKSESFLRVIITWRTFAVVLVTSGLSLTILLPSAFDSFVAKQSFFVRICRCFWWSSHVQLHVVYVTFVPVLQCWTIRTYNTEGIICPSMLSFIKINPPSTSNNRVNMLEHKGAWIHSALYIHLSTFMQSRTTPSSSTLYLYFVRTISSSGENIICDDKVNNFKPPWNVLFIVEDNRKFTTTVIQLSNTI